MCAVMDWRSHKVLCCMEAALCLNALHKALSLTGTKPGNFNCLRSAALRAAWRLAVSLRSARIREAS